MTYPDVVVVLPGLIGSVLAKDGKTIWGTSPGALWGVVAGNALRDLELAAPDDGSDDLGDGIVPTGLIANPEIVPGLWKQGGYTRLGRDLVQSLQLVEGRNYFEFAYDWRRDNRVSARRLARDAHGWLKEWRTTSGNDDARIVLIAHSMGGLVARHYIECLEGWRAVRMLVSFGTPYRGSGNALDFLSNGFRWKVGPIGLFDGTRALRSFASVHQLLPTYPFIEAGDGTMSRVTDLELPNIDAGATRSAAAFHAEIADAVAGRSSDPRHSSPGPLVRPIVGTEQPTWQSAKIVSDKIVMSRLHETLDLKGDGTVSRVSAIPIEGSETHATYVAATHSSLQSVDEALSHLRGVLTGTTIDLDRFRRKSGAAGSIELRIDDMYASDEPVVLSAVPSRYVQTLEAVIEPFEKDLGILRTALMPDDGRYSGSVRLPAGLYRVTVKGRNMRPVMDIFLVQDRETVR